ncbi:MAG: hypothetical protein GY753_00325 [Gammaproteobacteria bacterium]|nr:hypothetical protein [Gammaproteobacteria bacterium]
MARAIQVEPVLVAMSQYQLVVDPEQPVVQLALKPGWVWKAGQSLFLQDLATEGMAVISL